MKPAANPTPLPPEPVLNERKARAAAWFQDLQGQIDALRAQVAAFSRRLDQTTP